ncbi:MAG: Na+/H+ antiporter NhaA [Bacteroidota bacterium]
MTKPSLFQKFIKIEGLSGFLLFGATILAMVWANSPYADTYEALWNAKLGLDLIRFELIKPAILWVNDGLMAIFFFLIGLEIKREVLIGELNSIRKATFPFFAALGGMFAPLALFVMLNQNPATTQGWGIPMATDIAFSLAILNLLGRSVPLSLKIFLTAFAIVDDLGAVMVIAVFYSSGINWLLIIISLALLGILFFLSSRNFYSKYLTFGLGIVIWVLFLKSGIHPTIAGVLLAFTVPIRQKIDFKTFVQELSGIEDEIEDSDPNKGLTKEMIHKIDHMESLLGKVQSPLQHLEHKLHGWVAYFIMPIFALANAGISFSTDAGFDFLLAANIATALFAGKLIGIPLLSFLSVKLKLAELPENVNWMQIIGVAILAGVGFTMSIFIANLAFADESLYVGSAKVGILIGSFVSGVVGALILKLSGRAYARKAAATEAVK